MSEARHRHWFCRLEFKPQDLWVGVFWKNDEQAGAERRVFNAWVCILPTLPIHLGFVEVLDL